MLGVQGCCVRGEGCNIRGVGCSLPADLGGNLVVGQTEGGEERDLLPTRDGPVKTVTKKQCGKPA